MILFINQSIIWKDSQSEKISRWIYLLLSIFKDKLDTILKYYIKIHYITIGFCLYHKNVCYLLPVREEKEK